MQLVGSRLGNETDCSATSSSELGFEAVRIDAELVDGFKRRRVDHRPKALFERSGWRGRQAIQSRIPTSLLPSTKLQVKGLARRPSAYFRFRSNKSQIQR